VVNVNNEEEGVADCSKPFKAQWRQMVTFKSVQCHPDLTYIFNF